MVFTAHPARSATFAVFTFLTAIFGRPPMHHRTCYRQFTILRSNTSAITGHIGSTTTTSQPYNSFIRHLLHIISSFITIQYSLIVLTVLPMPHKISTSEPSKNHLHSRSPSFRCITRVQAVRRHNWVCFALSLSRCSSCFIRPLSAHFGIFT